MTALEIILDWLKLEENRNELPVRECNKCEYDGIKQYGHIYHFFGAGESVTVIGNLGDKYFKIIDREEKEREY